MTFPELLERLRQQDIYLTIDGEKLRVNAPKGALTPQLQAELSSRKMELLQFLKEKPTARSAYPPISARENLVRYPLSLGQERIWTSARQAPDSPLYNMYLAYQLEGQLNMGALEMALEKIVERHSILRIKITSQDGQPIACTDAPVGSLLKVIDLKSENAEAWIRQEIIRPFNLETEIPFRASLAKTGYEQGILVLVMHHIASDGWSWANILGELSAAYSSFDLGRDLSLPPLPVQYPDYALWQRELVDGSFGSEQRDAWQAHLEGAAELHLPVNGLPSGSYAGARIELALDANLAEGLRKLSRRAGSTLYTTLLSLFYTCLYSFSFQEDLLVCSPVANRPLQQMQPLVGYFNNLIPLRAFLSSETGFALFLQQVRKIVEKAIENQDYPFHLLNDLPGLEWLSLSRAVFALQDGSGRQLQLDAISVTPLPAYNETTSFPLFLTVEESGQELFCTLEYQSSLFTRETAQEILRRYSTLAGAVCNDENIRVSSLVSPFTIWTQTSGDKAVEMVKPRTELERRLVIIWQECLGIPEVSIQDNFFAMGGHSLLALRLFRRVETDLDANLPLSALYTHPTVEGLAELIQKGSAAVSWDTLFPIQSYGYLPPFFGVHGMTGNVLFWRFIVRHLRPDQPFYALQARGLDGLQSARSSIPEMAQVYLEEIHKVQPKGPYYLGGFSLGGEIAFEMAQQLTAAGEQVGLLVLFDTGNPVRAVRPEAKSDVKMPLLEGTGHLAILGRKLHGHWDRLQGLSGPQKAAYLGRDMMMRLGRLQVRAMVAWYRQQKKALPEKLRVAHMDEMHMKAVLDYIPAPYPGRITLFRATETLEASPIDDPLGWGPLALGGLDLHLVNSTHRLVDEEFAPTVARKLTECLDAVRKP